MDRSIYFSRQYIVKWSEVDPNQHLRGTVYIDYADHTRFAYMQSQGITNEKIKELQIGPIIFNVSASYQKEVHLNETVTVNCMLDYMSEDGRKFGISHEIFNQKGELACKVKAEGAWFDLKARKVIAPPPFISDALKRMNEINKKDNGKT